MEKSAKRNLIFDDLDADEGHRLTPGKSIDSQMNTPGRTTGSPAGSPAASSSVKKLKCTESPHSQLSTPAKSTGSRHPQFRTAGKSSESPAWSPAASSSAKKQSKLPNLKATINLTMADMDTYTSSAIYHFSKDNKAAGTEQLEKGRRLVTGHNKKSLALLEGIESDCSAQDKKINSLKQRETFLLNKIGDMQQEMEQMTQEMDKLQKQNDSIFSDDAFDDSAHLEDSLHSDGGHDKLKAGGSDEN